VGAKTAIEWTDATWNPMTGCRAVSPGCANCYARRMALRLPAITGGHGFAPTFHPERLAIPIHWRKPRRVFVCSMSDLFLEEFTDEQIAAVYGAMVKAFWHTFIVLTKRPERAREWYRLAAGGRGVWDKAQKLDWSPWAFPAVNRGEAFVGWPPRNVWLGVTAEDELRADMRIPDLLAIPAAVRFVSCEPLLGRIRLSPFLVRYGIDWVIAGAETGPGRRSVDDAAFRLIRDQCEAARVPFFLKKRSSGSSILDGLVYHEWPAPHHTTAG
jgi:protein gp37